MANQPTFEIIFSALSEQVFEGTELTPEGRRAVEERVREANSHESRGEPRTKAPWPPEVFELVDEIAQGKEDVTDADVDDLPAELSDDEIFEIVLAAAITAGRRRIEVGLGLVANADVGKRFSAA